MEQLVAHQTAQLEKARELPDSTNTKAAQAKRTPEERSKRAKDAANTLTHEQRQERARKGYEGMSAQARTDKAVAGVAKRAEGLVSRRKRHEDLRVQCERVKLFMLDALSNVQVQPEADADVRRLGEDILKIDNLIETGHQVGGVGLTSAETIWADEVLPHFHRACAVLGIRGAEIVVAASTSSSSPSTSQVTAQT